jgi:desulfoferrodoxin (superoxide reductase-like protein)
MTQLIDIHRVSCKKQGWVFPAGENDSRKMLSGEIAGPNLAHHFVHWINANPRKTVGFD